MIIINCSLKKARKWTMTSSNKHPLNYSYCCSTGKRNHKQLGSYRLIVSSLEQVIWVEDPLIVCPQMRANSLAGSKAHLDGYFSPAALSADGIEASLFIHQLGKGEITYSVLMCFFIYLYVNKHFLVNFF